MRFLNFWRSVLGKIVLVAAPIVFFVVFSITTNFSTDILFMDLAYSLGRMIIAFLIAAAFGWVGAIAFYGGKRGAVALPIFDVLQSFPTFAALPLAVSFFGPSNTTVIVFLVLTIIWPIFFAIISAMKLVKTDWREAVEINGLSNFSYLRYFIVPVSLPSLIAGSIVGIGEGWEALIATEIIVKPYLGLGNFFQRFVNNPMVTIMGIIGFLLIIYSVNKLVWLPLLEWSHHSLEE